MQKVTYKGRKYKSISIACDLLGISPVTVCANYKGVPVEQAFDRILENKQRHNCIDHLGYGFESKRAMAEFYKIPYDILVHRLRSHWNLKLALTTPPQKGKCSCTDHLGNKFESVIAMAEFHNIPYNVLYNRLKNGWNVQKALTTPKKNKRKNIQCKNY